KASISQHTLSFRRKYIPNLTEGITTHKGMTKLKEMGFDCYVVGSDQCWRPRYSPNIYNFFLDFIKDQPDITRISYAASFGTSEWEFDSVQPRRCQELVQHFDGVSVREVSGVGLCKEY